MRFGHTFNKIFRLANVNFWKRFQCVSFWKLYRYRFCVNNRNINLLNSWTMHILCLVHSYVCMDRAHVHLFICLFIKWHWPGINNTVFSRFHRSIPMGIVLTKLSSVHKSFNKTKGKSFPFVVQLLRKRTLSIYLGRQVLFPKKYQLSIANSVLMLKHISN